MALKSVKVKRGKRTKGLRTYVNQEEESKIEQRAAEHKLTVSAFLRIIALDPKLEPVKSVNRLRTLQEDSRQAQLL